MPIRPGRCLDNRAYLLTASKASRRRPIKITQAAQASFKASETVRCIPYYPAISAIDNSTLERDRYRMRAVIRRQFCKNAFHVCFNSLFGNSEMLCNSFVGVSQSDLSKHLRLSQAQRLAGRMRCNLHGNFRGNTLPGVSSPA